MVDRLPFKQLNPNWHPQTAAPQTPVIDQFAGGVPTDAPLLGLKTRAALASAGVLTTLLAGCKAVSSEGGKSGHHGQRTEQRVPKGPGCEVVSTGGTNASFEVKVHGHTGTLSFGSDAGGTWRMMMSPVRIGGEVFRDDNLPLPRTKTQEPIGVDPKGSSGDYPPGQVWTFTASRNKASLCR